MNDIEIEILSDIGTVQFSANELFWMTTNKKEENSVTVNFRIDPSNTSNALMSMNNKLRS